MVSGGDGWPVEPDSQSNKYYQHELRLIGVCSLWTCILQVIDRLKFKQRKDGLLKLRTGNQLKLQEHMHIVGEVYC